MQLALDFSAPRPASRPTPPPAPLQASLPTGMDRRRLVGRRSLHRGAAAETQALRRYLARGWRLEARNWRAERVHGGGELDLILWRDGWYAFVEVKARRSLDEAAGAVTPAQFRRLDLASQRFLNLRGADFADRRFDLAICDQWGRMEILENAFA